MHTLLVLLAILGGLAVYGILGIIYGPLIVTAFLTLSDLYITKYEQHIEPELMAPRRQLLLSAGRSAA